MSKFIELHDADSECVGLFNIHAINVITPSIDGPGTLVQMATGEIMIASEEYEHIKSRLLEEMQ